MRIPEALGRLARRRVAEQATRNGAAATEESGEGLESRHGHLSGSTAQAVQKTGVL